MVLKTFQTPTIQPLPIGITFQDKDETFISTYLIYFLNLQTLKHKKKKKNLHIKTFEVKFAIQLK